MRRREDAAHTNMRERQFLRKHMAKLQGRMVNDLAPSAEEGRGTLRKAPMRRVQPVSRRFPNGETHAGACLHTAW